MIINKLINDRIKKLRMQIVLAEDFFASVAMMKLKQSMEFEIAATDGQIIVYNPKFFKSIPDSEVLFILYHEFLHIILMHHFRRQKRDPRLWNVATDIAINLLIEKTKNWTVPSYGVMRDSYSGHDFNCKTAEEIYDILKAEQKKNPQNQSLKDMIDQASGMPLHDNGSLSDQPDTSEAAQAKAKQVIQQTLDIADQNAKRSHSSLSARIREEIRHDINLNDYPWYMQLFDQFTSLIHDDYSFQRPNNRYIQQGVYMPINYRNAIRKIAFAIDTSGSMNSEQLNLAMSHINDIVQAVSVATVDLIQCDLTIHQIDSLSQSEFQDLLTNKFVGRGGTDLHPPFTYYEENPDEAPDVLVYYTDLDAYAPHDAPDYPVFWVTNSKRNANFGTVIRI